ncbi:MAG: hypothetical protein QM765_27790 [Myxococcales bacterium]
MRVPRGVTRRLKILGGTLLALVLVKALWFFTFRTDGARLLAGEERTDLMARRAYLVHRLLQEKTDAQGMKTPGGIFSGEWFVGSLSMTAAACTNLAFLYPDTRAQAVAEIDQLVVRALEPAAREFDKGMWRGEDALDSLAGPNGHIGYLGHVALMLDERRLLAGPGAADPHGELGGRIVEALARRMAASPSSHLETYPDEVYAMDNAVVAAAIALHDLGTGEDHRAVLDRWIGTTRAGLLDPETGLVSFSLGKDGRPNQRSRGSGVCWNSFFLPFVDQAFAAGQFDRIREHLVDRPLGIVGAREVRRGSSFVGDVDSGPVLLGLSPSGTGFCLAGARHAGDARLLGELLDTAELAGFTWQWNGERRYLLAPFVGDAIVLAMKTAVLWDRRFLSVPVPARPD